MRRSMNEYRVQPAGVTLAHLRREEPHPTIQEVAEGLGISLGTAYNRMHRFRKALAHEL